jgi:2-C-methyl-D-erythritol 4-phosphate cytidylyltransferase
MNKYILIVAGGSGSRMQAKLPKQFLLLKEKPILMHTIMAFKNYDKKCQIILVLPENHMEYWENLCAEYNFKVEHLLVKGGKTRFHSVLNGLNSIEKEGIVAIHDGVRPLVSAATIKECIQSAAEKGNAIPVVLVNDSVRKIDLSENYSVDRKNYRLVQTPQCFKSELIKAAYRQKYSEHFTDDASVLENMGVKINLVQGNLENIKITTQIDLKIAGALME